jgi:hypothetical protein
MITYLDNEKPKSKIIYLDEQVGLKDFFPKVKLLATPEEATTTITPADIGQGIAVPLAKTAMAFRKGVLKAQEPAIQATMGAVRGQTKILSEKVPFNAIRGIQALTPMQPQLAGLASISNPREIINKIIEEGAVRPAFDPATPVLAMAGGGPGILKRPVEGMAGKIGKGLEGIAGLSSKAKNLSIMKQGKSYLYENVAKPISEIVSKNIKTNPEIGRALGLKDETIALLKQHGYDKVADPKLADELATQAFREATSKKATVYGDKIDIADTLDVLQRKYNKIKSVNPKNPIKDVIGNIKGLRPAAKGFYATGERVPTPTHLKRMFKGEKLEDIAREVRVSREQFSDIRQQIDNLYRARVINKGDVLDIVDSLYNSAEKSGLTGMQKARELYHQARQFEDVATNLSKIEKLDPVKIHSELQSVVEDPTKYQGMVDKYTPYLGKAKAKQIFDEALSVRRGGKIIKRTVGAGLLGAAGKFGLGILH